MSLESVTAEIFSYQSLGETPVDRVVDLSVDRSMVFDVLASVDCTPSVVEFLVDRCSELPAAYPHGKFRVVKNRVIGKNLHVKGCTKWSRRKLVEHRISSSKGVRLVYKYCGCVDYEMMVRNRFTFKWLCTAATLLSDLEENQTLNEDDFINFISESNDLWLIKDKGISAVKELITANVQEWMLNSKVADPYILRFQLAQHLEHLISRENYLSEQKKALVHLQEVLSVRMPDSLSEELKEGFTKHSSDVDLEFIQSVIREFRTSTNWVFSQKTNIWWSTHLKDPPFWLNYVYVKAWC